MAGFQVTAEGTRGTVGPPLSSQGL